MSCEDWCLDNFFYQERWLRLEKWVWVSLWIAISALGYFRLLLLDKSKGWIIHTNIIVSLGFEKHLFDFVRLRGRKTQSLTSRTSDFGAGQKRWITKKTGIRMRACFMKWIWNLAWRKFSFALKMIPQISNYVTYKLEIFPLRIQFMLFMGKYYGFGLYLILCDNQQFKQYAHHKH